MVPPVQSTSETTEVNVPSSVVTGLARVTCCSVTVQPVTASGERTAIGWSVGTWIRNAVTDAVVDSLGTRKPRTTSPDPWGTDEGLMVTCAEAGGAQRSRMTAAANTPATDFFR